ncbi:hypothetical protein AADG42_08460 [Ammonicoccus fulvus]|uniref:Uncharacterized protein n=1 Tax=Ammonicoccus fulvus TaxID=3138240 RepID=A0ABZ3FRC2_9ACTN
MDCWLELNESGKTGDYQWVIPMNDASRLMRVDGRAILLFASLGDDEMAAAMTGWREAGLTVRCVRGVKMRGFAGLMDEFAAALQFPYYWLITIQGVGVV